MRASFENVEKVVNPPQTPIVRNRDQELPSLEVLLKYLAAPPRKLPQPAITIFFKISGSIVAFKILFPKIVNVQGY